MISVIVPTHDDRFLSQTVESVFSQEYPDYEVVLVPNGGGKVAPELAAHPKVRVVPYEGGSTFVGAIKRFAFGAAKGDILVELDHDDLLLPGALSKVARAVEGGAGFVYSDFAEFREDKTLPQAFNPYYGWAPEPRELLGRKALVYAAWDADPASMGLIHYAPNHVRAWTRDAYQKAGGHDPRLSVCDDHDLVVRTYYTSRMVRIPECLYLYRVHGKNTWLERNAEIQKKTWEIYSKNIEALVLRWTRLRGLPAVQLNVAYDLSPGWTLAPKFGADQHLLPWHDHSVGAFKADDMLHGFADKSRIMGELHRCLAPGGWILSTTPAAPSKGAYMDPNTRSFWNENAFWYWTDRNFARWIGNDSVRFRAHRLVEGYPGDWHRQNDIRYVTADLQALKDGYVGPGPRSF
jgi:glycosyltransferase involved in cell wall biosynthesis